MPPNTEEEWRQEAISFIENYGFPSVGAWMGFTSTLVQN